MKLNAKLFDKNLILEKKQMEDVKGATHWTHCGYEGLGTSHSTNDFMGDGADSGKNLWKCHVADDYSNW